VAWEDECIGEEVAIRKDAGRREPTDPDHGSARLAPEPVRPSVAFP
jgi:hypothetical protein